MRQAFFQAPPNLRWDNSARPWRVRHRRPDVSGNAAWTDAGRTVKERKRHIVLDALSLVFGLAGHAADLQDRDGAPAVLNSIRHACPWLRHVFADAGYAGLKLCGARDRMGDWTLQIVKRSAAALREAVDSQSRRHGARFVVAVQLCTDLARMPVEDASVLWPEGESP